MHMLSLEDWYNVSLCDVIKSNGHRVLQHFEGSLLHALQKVYPQQQWELSSFKHFPVKSWTDFRNHIRFFDWLAAKLGISKVHISLFYLLFAPKQLLKKKDTNGKMVQCG